MPCAGTDPAVLLNTTAGASPVPTAGAGPVPTAAGDCNPTVTVAMAPPTEPAQLSVNDVDCVIAGVRKVPLAGRGPDHPPDAWQRAAPSADHDSDVLSPCETVVGFAVKLIAGRPAVAATSASELSLSEPALPHPASAKLNNQTTPGGVSRSLTSGIPLSPVVMW